MSKKSSLKFSSKKEPNLNILDQHVQNNEAVPVIVRKKIIVKDVDKETKQKALIDFLKTPEELRLEAEKRKIAKKQKELSDHFFLKNTKPDYRIGFRSAE